MAQLAAPGSPLVSQHSALSFPEMGDIVPGEGAIGPAAAHNPRDERENETVLRPIEISASRLALIYPDFADRVE
jgi:hypothetical protein